MGWQLELPSQGIPGIPYFFDVILTLFGASQWLKEFTRWASPLGCVSEALQKTTGILTTQINNLKKK